MKIKNLTTIVHNNNNRVGDCATCKNEIQSLRSEISNLTTLVNQLLVESRSSKVPEAMVDKHDSAHDIPTARDSTKCEADHSANDQVTVLEPSGATIIPPTSPSPTSSAQIPAPKPHPPKDVPTWGDTTKVFNMMSSEVITVDNSKRLLCIGSFN
jgi:hypothetical protein